MQPPCWTFNHATDGIGRSYPQHQGMRPGYDFDSPNSVHRLPDNALPDFEPDFDTVIIHGHAKLTDLLSSTAIKNTGFLVSPRLRAIFERFVLPLHQYYPVPMVHRNKPIADYSWLQLPDLRLSLTDTSSIADAESTISAIPELTSLDLLKMVRPARFAYCLISDPLRKALESAKITGVRFGTAKLFRSSARPDLHDRQVSEF